MPAGLHRPDTSPQSDNNSNGSDDEGQQRQIDANRPGSPRFRSSRGSPCRVSIKKSSSNNENNAGGSRSSSIDKTLCSTSPPFRDSGDGSRRCADMAINDIGDLAPYDERGQVTSGTLVSLFLHSPKTTTTAADDDERGGAAEGRDSGRRASPVSSFDALNGGGIRGNAIDGRQVEAADAAHHHRQQQHYQQHEEIVRMEQEAHKGEGEEGRAQEEHQTAATDELTHPDGHQHHHHYDNPRDQYQQHHHYEIQVHGQEQQEQQRQRPEHALDAAVAMDHLSSDVGGGSGDNDFRDSRGGGIGAEFLPYEGDDTDLSGRGEGSNSSVYDGDGRGRRPSAGLFSENHIDEGTWHHTS